MEHPDQGVITKLWVKNVFIGIFFLDKLMQGTAPDKALTLQVVLLISYWDVH